ncbi:hypothetical protein FXO38_21451 [Capsicum annuum]|nr:hypothetical protein FXO38_21451 [Capsicum annuum]KAF3677087.1 hypothetical protein FXO37_04973 [Capsicum annuum]
MSFVEIVIEVLLERNNLSGPRYLWDLFISFKGISSIIPGSTLELVSRWNVWRNRNNNKDRWKIIPAAIWWKVLKIADFGLARLSYDTDTHVSTRVMGTFGYLAHEYALTGKLTEKSDVFSFGVMLLEIITRRWPIDKAQHYLDDNIVD